MSADKPERLTDEAFLKIAQAKPWRDCNETELELGRRLTAANQKLAVAVALLDKAEDIIEMWADDNSGLVKDFKEALSKIKESQ